MAESVLSAGAEIFKCLVRPVGRQFSYFRNYKGNLDSLKREVKNLTDAREGVLHRVDDAKRKGDEVEKGVENWLINVEKIIDEAQKIIEDEEKTKDQFFKGLCPNLKDRYKLSKKAVREVKATARLLEEGKFDTVSYKTIPQEIWLTAAQGYEPFESRMSTLRDIQSALSNPDVKMIGVYGMPGVGKTTLVKQVARQSKKNNLFDEVLFAEVSHNPKIKKIQGQLADKLGMEFCEESESGRARRLCERLRKEKKILIILDDIWASLDLEAVGIPLGDDHKGCKILMTARSQDVLSSKMDSQNNFSIGVLDEKDSWRLFKQMTGDCIVESRDLQSVATDVAKECAGLPIAIVTIAKALRGKGLYEWRNALRQLRRPSPRNFIETVPAATYSSIELSFNHLEGEELKSTFLLISYGNIFSNLELLKYGMGLGLFQGIDTMEEARDRLYTLVHKLKDSCLLVDGYAGEDFSIHDIIADVAISIAARDYHVFGITNELVPRDWPDKDALKNCNAISLANDTINELPEGLECPHLKFFSVYTSNQNLKIPDNFFTWMTELRVLDLTGMHLLRLPASLHFLVNLRTLCLDHCTLKDIVGIENLKKLEILSFSGSDIEQLPAEIGQLNGLRLLDLTDCFKLKVIPPNVLSNLSGLEELYMGNTSIEWDIEGINTERSSASLDELTHLSNLTTLEIYIKDAKIVPKGLLSKKLERYKIFTGVKWNSFVKFKTSKTLKLKLNYSSVCLKELQGIKNVEDLYLDEWQGEDVLYELDKEGFSELKHLHVQNSYHFWHFSDSVRSASCEAFPLLESLFLYNLDSEKICCNQLTTQPFCKLRIVNVRKCYNLLNIFTFSIPRCLRQLQKFEVIDCCNLEEILAIESQDNSSNNEFTDEIEFGQLRYLTLNSLPMLRSFYSQDQAPSTMQDRRQELTTANVWPNEIILEDELDTPLTLFNEHVVFPNLEALALSAIKFAMIWSSQLATTCLKNLTSLIVKECDNLKYIFSSSMVRNLMQLQHLEISNCPVLEEVVMQEGAEAAVMFVFPQLTTLKLCDLPDLRAFCSGMQTSEWPVLKKIDVYGCDKIKIFDSDLFSIQEAHEEGQLDIPLQQPFPLFLVEQVFPNLEELALNGKDIKMIWQGQFPEHLFVKLKLLVVVDDESDAFPLGILRSFCNLEQLELLCASYKRIFSNEEAGNVMQLKILTVQECHCLHDLEPSSTSFRNLTALEVWNCDGLKNLVSSSTAKGLVQLAELSIYKCKMMTEVVAEGCDAEEDEIVFRKLKRLSVERLKSLTSFCSANYTFKFPSLKVLRVRKCPKMKTFTEGVISTPKLQRVEQDWNIDKGCWEGDLNTTIQKLHEETDVDAEADDEEQSETTMSEVNVEEEDDDGSIMEENDDAEDDDEYALDK